MKTRASIKLRLLAVALAFNVVTLSALSVLGYFWYRSENFRSLDTYLETDARGIVDTIDGYLASQLKGSFSASAVSQTLDKPDFEAFMESVAESHRNSPQVFKTTISVFDAAGRRLFVSNNAIPVDLPSPESMSAFALSRSHAESALVTVDDEKDLDYRLVSVPVVHRGKPVALVQEACLMQSAAGPVRTLRDLLVVGLPLLWTSSGGIMYLLLRRAFNPVNDMVRTIERITETDLKVRVPIPPTNDEISHLAATFNDMLDRVDAAFDFQSRLAQDLSHQLRTPLAVLKGTLETGLRRVRSADEYQEILESNLEEVNRIARLIESILLLARLDSKAAPLDLADLEPGPLLEELKADLTPLWEQKNLSLSLDDGTGGALVRGDRARLRQVYLNILDNAWKYCPEDGAIRISLRRDGDWVETEIHNDGPRVPDAEAERLFRRFYRAPETGARASADGREPGFGLGLSIARSIVDLHRGEIFCKSPASGGASFFIRLPAAPPPPSQDA